jgi:hypothetical protein
MSKKFPIFKSLMANMKDVFEKASNFYHAQNKMALKPSQELDVQAKKNAKIQLELAAAWMEDEEALIESYQNRRPSSEEKVQHLFQIRNLIEDRHLALACFESEERVLKHSDWFFDGVGSGYCPQSGLQEPDLFDWLKKYSDLEAEDEEFQHLNFFLEHKSNFRTPTTTTSPLIEETAQIQFVSEWLKEGKISDFIEACLTGALSINVIKKFAPRFDGVERHHLQLILSLMKGGEPGSRTSFLRDDMCYRIVAIYTIQSSDRGRMPESEDDMKLIIRLLGRIKNKTDDDYRNHNKACAILDGGYYMQVRPFMCGMFSLEKINKKTDKDRRELAKYYLAAIEKNLEIDSVKNPFLNFLELMADIQDLYYDDMVFLVELFKKWKTVESAPYVESVQEINWEFFNCLERYFYCVRPRQFEPNSYPDFMIDLIDISSRMKTLPTFSQPTFKSVINTLLVILRKTFCLNHPPTANKIDRLAEIAESLSDGPRTSFFGKFEAQLNGFFSKLTTNLRQIAPVDSEKAPNISSSSGMQSDSFSRSSKVPNYQDDQESIDNSSSSNEPPCNQM